MVPNAAPSVDAGGPYSVIEGSSVTLNAAGSDPNGDALSYAWDLDNNGTFETPGQSATFSALSLNAPSSYTVRVQATDSLGLTAVDEATVNVIFNFVGFLSPIDNPPVLNILDAGRGVAIKFTLNGDQGLDIFAPGYPASQPIACSTGTSTDGVEETITAAFSMLTYKPETGVYTYAWKTNRAWKGTCRQFTMVLADGTVHTALFQFR